MIKTVYFDLGNVLVFFCMKKCFAQISACTGLTPESVKQLILETDLRESYERGLIDTETVYKRFQTKASKPFSLHAFKEAFANIFTPNRELFPVIEQLKSQGIRLIALSNTSECHFNYIHSHYPIIQQFDHLVLSYEVGVWKPDPRIFEKALLVSGCAPEECFYTDDIPEFIASARYVGLPGEIFTTVPKLKQQLVDRGCCLI